MTNPIVMSIIFFTVTLNSCKKTQQHDIVPAFKEALKSESLLALDFYTRDVAKASFKYTTTNLFSPRPSIFTNSVKSERQTGHVTLLGVSQLFNSGTLDKPRYLNKDLFNADPAVHVFDGKIYIYPSHDIESGIPENDNGDHFNMKDYHVYSMVDMTCEAVDHGVALEVKDVPWSGRQMWAPDCAEKNGIYYFYFPMKDKNDIFRIGLAIGDKPEGPFRAESAPISGSYSIDPAVFKDDDGQYYMTFGGLWGGQLQHYRNNKAIECGQLPDDNEPALCGKIARLSDDMKMLGEEPRDILILDEKGEPILASDHDRYFFEASKLHKHKGKYYFTYSTGNTHKLCYAIGDNVYGPFVYGGVILTPVVGWTTHHSIIEFKGKSYLFYHDSVLSGGKTWLRNMKVRELRYNENGSIITMDGMD